jgi:carboxylate-amine ligase
VVWVTGVRLTDTQRELIELLNGHDRFRAIRTSRLGLEWEIACVDRRSGELSPAAPELLSRLGPANTFPHVTGELLTNTVEVVSAPHRKAANAVDDLTRMVEYVSGPGRGATGRR